MIRFTLAILLFSNMASAAIASNGSYQIDPAHTNIGFEVGHLGVSLVVGRFNTFAGNIQVADGAAKISVEINTASIDTNVAQRDNHLRSEDFFDVEVFPTMKFESGKIEFDGEGNPSVINGSLTLHGVTKEIALKVTPLASGKGPMGESRIGYKATATIKRTDFGMEELLALAGDEVTILLNVEAIKQ